MSLTSWPVARIGPWQDSQMDDIVIVPHFSDCSSYRHLAGQSTGGHSHCPSLRGLAVARIGPWQDSQMEDTVNVPHFSDCSSYRTRGQNSQMEDIVNVPHFLACSSYRHLAGQSNGGHSQCPSLL